MRRFIVGLLVGVAVGWVIAWWRLGRAGQVGLTEVGREPMRIALPDLPWGKEEEEVPEAEPVAAEVDGPAQEAAEEILARAREAVAGPEPLLAYCARCRTKRPIQDPEPTATSDGRPAVRGTCPECGAKMFRFVSY
jgi:hypothetical protein